MFIRVNENKFAERFHIHKILHLHVQKMETSIFQDIYTSVTSGPAVSISRFPGSLTDNCF